MAIQETFHMHAAVHDSSYHCLSGGLPLEVEQAYACFYAQSLSEGTCFTAQSNCNTRLDTGCIQQSQLACLAIYLMLFSPMLLLVTEIVSSEACHSFVGLCLHRNSVAALCCSEEQRLLLLALLLLASSLLCLLLLQSWAGMLHPAYCILPFTLLQAIRPHRCASQTRINGSSSSSAHVRPWAATVRAIEVTCTHLTVRRQCRRLQPADRSTRCWRCSARG